MTPIIDQVVAERDRLQAEATVLRRDNAYLKARASALENQIGHLLNLCKKQGVPVSSSDLIHGQSTPFSTP